MSVELINQIYRDQLGRNPDSAGQAYYLNKLAQGVPLEQLEMELNQSLEGQNFDTQFFTSTYRGMFNRNPEQEGFQYWMSLAQSNPLSPDELTPYITEAARNQDIAAVQQALAQGRYTNVASPSLEADPYGGRFLTGSIYDVPTDAANISMINGEQVQFAAPVTQVPVVSDFGGQTSYAARGGIAVLDDEVTMSSVTRAMNSGAMSTDQYGELLDDLGAAKTVDDIYAALNKPKAQLVLDPTYSIQLGQGMTVEEAERRADAMRPVLDAVDQGFYPSNMRIADVARDMGIYNAFGPGAFEGNTQMTVDDIINEENAAARASGLQDYLYQNIGSREYMATPMPYGFYSERGLETQYSPLTAQQGPSVTDLYTNILGRQPDSQGLQYYQGLFGPTINPTELNTFIRNISGDDVMNQQGYNQMLSQVQNAAPMFRSGVFGYTPTGPSGFDFGIQPITQQIPVFTPGTFNALATGYDALGNPILEDPAQQNPTTPLNDFPTAYDDGA